MTPTLLLEESETVNCRYLRRSDKVWCLRSSLGRQAAAVGAANAVALKTAGIEGRRKLGWLQSVDDIAVCIVHITSWDIMIVTKETI